MLLLIALVTLSSCAHKLPDEPICVETSPTSGYCTNTISNKETFPEGQAWAEIKKYSLVLPLGSWAEIKKFILDICKDYGKCSEDPEVIESEEAKKLKATLIRIEEQIPTEELERASDIDVKMNLNLP